MKYKKIIAGIIVIVITAGSYVYFVSKKNVHQEVETVSQDATLSPEISSTLIPTKDGVYPGFIKDVSSLNGKYSLKIDFVQVVSCFDHPDVKNCESGTTFTTVNVNPLIRTFLVADDAQVKIQNFWSNYPIGKKVPNESPFEIVNVETWKDLFSGTLVPDGWDPTKNKEITNPDPVYLNPYDAGVYYITVKAGVVTNINQMYQQ